VSPETTLIGLDDVLAAREAIGTRLHRTPMFSARQLGERTGTNIHLKAELFQRTGSFKIRGVLAKLATLTAEEKSRGVIGISAGNHAQALAYGAALEGIPSLVVMWQSASPQKVEATRAYGAQVDLESPDPGEAFDRLDELIEETGMTLVHPFDDPYVIAGQGTLGLEILEDVPDVDTILVAVGGGGLVAGIATAVKALRPEVRIIGVEPDRSAALHAGLAAGQWVRVRPDSIADGLSAPFAGEHCIAIAQDKVDDVVLVTEDEIRDGMRYLYQRAKLACEAAGAVPTAALLAGTVDLPRGSTVVSVVSGGNVAPRTASGILDPDEG
jgi:threonine dehydratase